MEIKHTLLPGKMEPRNSMVDIASSGIVFATANLQVL